MNLAINNVVEVAINRTVSAYQPGIGKKDFRSTATTYGQLKTELIQQGFNLRDVRVSEGNTRIDLVNDDALLPTNIQKRGQITNDLIIVITPRERPKSGAMDINTAPYKELRTAIYKLCHTPATAIKATVHFGNYTQMKTEVMRSKLQSWHAAASAKLEREALENTPNEEVTIPQNQYNEAIQHILYGVNILQNILNQSSETPTEEELIQLANMQSNFN